MALNNAETINLVRSIDSSFAAKTPEVTMEELSTKGYGPFTNPTLRDEWFGLYLQHKLQKVTLAKVKDLFESQDFGEEWSGDIGAYIQQRIYEKIVPCINPQYMGIKEGDEFKFPPVRKGDQFELFWQANEDLQSLITVPDEFQYKGIFNDPYGMDRFVTGKVNGMMEGFKLQKYLVKKDALYHSLTDSNYPLKADQHAEATALQIGDADSVIEFVTLIRNIVSQLVFSPTGCGGKFNAAGYADGIDADQLRLVVRPWLFNIIQSIPRLNLPASVELPIKVVNVEDFGGTDVKLVASKKYVAGQVCLVSDDSTPSYAEYVELTRNTDEATVASSLTGAVKTPIFDKVGVRVATAYYLSTGIATTGTGQSAVTYKTIYVPIENSDIDDPLEDTMALIADKRLIFSTQLNPVSVEPIRDGFRKMTHYSAVSPKNQRGFDPTVTLIQITEKAGN